MPFTPSSPVRLYASRRSGNPLHIGSAATTSTGETAEKRTSEWEAGTNMMTSIQFTTPGNVTHEQNPISPWETEGETEQRQSISQSLQRRSAALERPLSIQEALALSAINEEPSNRGSELPNITQRASTLFDNISESDYPVEEDIALIVGRASSVRVSKPQIVENGSLKVSKIQEQQAGHSASSSQSSLGTARVPSNHTRTLPTMLEETSLHDPSWTIRSVQAEDNAEMQVWPPAQSPDEEFYPLPAPTELGQRNPDSEHNPLTDDSALPTDNTLYSLHPSIVGPEIPSFANVNDSSIVLVKNLASTASATLTSPAKSLSRRVTIRPADIITKNHHDHSGFRESVVTTPYPSRASGEDNSMNAVRDGGGAPARRHSRRPHDNKKASYPYSPGRRDRFPSPERPERLCLALRLQDRPGAQAVIEVEITDRTTFDDEALFKQIRDVYKQHLLSRTQRPFNLIRKTSHVTATGISQLTNRHYPGFDSADFLKHLHSPQNGSKRKTWILWLRNHNSDVDSNRVSTNMPQIRHIDNLTRLSTRTRSSPHSRQSSAEKRNLQAEKDLTNVDSSQEKRLSTASDASSFYFAYSPAIPKLPFLSTRHNNRNIVPQSLTTEGAVQTIQTQSPCHSFFWPSTHFQSSTPTTTSLRKHKHNHTHDPHTTDTESQSSSHHPSLPTITLHYTFRLTTIALLTLLNVLFAITCAVIWIIFGVPGTRPGDDHETQIGVGGGQEATVGSDWKVNSQGRVSTGVVIGFVVFVVGLVGEGLLLWMARLVL